MARFDPAERPEIIASVVDQVEAVVLDNPATAIYFSKDHAVFVSGEAVCTLAALGGERSEKEIASGAILASATDGKRVVMGTDDGRVVALNADGETEVIATDPKRRWIDNVAVHSDGPVAWSAGKAVFVQSRDGEKSIETPSTAGGLAFAPKGLRLGISHYGGASLWFPNMATKVEQLEWAGSHLDIMFSPDNRFVVTAMHEPALHGWRLADGKHMRMTGYPARVRAASWCMGGKFLATSGADSVILWPFSGKDGPMGKEPMMLAAMRSKVSCVASHPTQGIVAAGYEDGTVILIRLPDGAEILARRGVGDAITALGWDSKGAVLAFAAESGDAGLLPIV